MFSVQQRLLLALLCGLTGALTLDARVLFRGNVTEDKRSFSFPLSMCVGGLKSEVFCAGAAEPGAKEYALSWATNGPEPRFQALSLEKVQLNYSEDAERNPIYNKLNPLYDKAIEHVALYASRPFMGFSYFPIVTLKDDPARLYMASSFVYLGTPKAQVGVISSDLINDAGLLGEVSETQDDGTQVQKIIQVRKPAPTDGIIGLCVASFEATALIFGAVKPHTEDGSGVFGQPGSGIAMLAYGAEWQPKDDEKKDEDLTEEERKKKAEEEARAKRRHLLTRDAIWGNKGNRAFPLDVRSVALDINNGMYAIYNETVDMCWDATLGRVYIALQVSTNPQASEDQGAVALLVGGLMHLQDEDGKPYTQFKCFPVVGAQGLQGADNKIVGALGAGKHVSLHKVRTMKTTLGLNYLVVVGGNGNRADTKDMVHALPLVSQRNDERFGKIAYKDASSHVEYTKNAKGGPGKHQKFMSRSLSSRPSRAATRGPEDAVQEKDLFTADDAATQVGSGRAPGEIVDILTYSDAVFVAVNGPRAGVYHSRALFNAQGMISAWTPWEQYETGPMHAFGIDGQGGIWTFRSDENDQSTIVQKTAWAGKTDLAATLAHEFPQDLGGVQGFFDFTLSADTPLAVATGYKKVALIDDERRVRVLTGDELDDVGAITCAQVITSDPAGWLMMGGSGGLAVLCDEHGCAWDTLVGIKNSFTTKPDIKKLGDYTFVRKIVQDGDNVYVLTNDRLDRIDLAQSDFATGQITVVTVANAAHLTGTPVDVGVSGPFALLATSSGLLRVGNGCDIATAESHKEVNWTFTHVPDAQACCLKLDCISPTGREVDFARNGQVQVLSVYTHTVLTRFAVRLEDEITDQTLQPLPDQKMKAYDHAHFLLFGGVLNDLPSDGALYFQTRSRHRYAPPYVKPIVSGMLSKRVTPLQLGIDDACYVHGMLHSPLMASWLAYGDFGLRETH